MNAKSIYYAIIAGISVVGTAVAELLGGWDAALQTLVIFMIADYFTGVVCALVWKKSPKSANGAFESKASLKGLFRKAGILLAVLIAYKLDQLAGTTVVRTAAIFFFIANDGFSIVENLGIMGLPMPDALTNAFELLKQKSGTSAVQSVIKGHFDAEQIGSMEENAVVQLAAAMGISTEGKTKEQLVQQITAQEVTAPAAE